MLIRSTAIGDWWIFFRPVLFARDFDGELDFAYLPGGDDPSNFVAVSTDFDLLAVVGDCDERLIQHAFRRRARNRMRMVSIPAGEGLPDLPPRRSVQNTVPGALVDILA